MLLRDHTSAELRNEAAEAGHQPLVWVFVALAAGLLLDRLSVASLLVWWGLAFLAFALWGMAFRRQQYSRSVVWLLLFLGFAGASWHAYAWRWFSVDEAGRFADLRFQPVCVEAVVRSDLLRLPQPKFDPLRAIPATERTRLEVQLLSIRDGDVWKPITGKAILTVDGHLQGITTGDHLQIFGSLARVAPARNSGEFDFALHQRAERTLTRIAVPYPECITRLAYGTNKGLSGWASMLRQQGVQLLERHLSPEYSGLAAAILLGDRGQVSHEQTQVFLTTGTIHILSISGLHVGLLGGMLFFALRLGLLGRGLSLLLIVGITASYVYVTGAEPPAMRAGITIAILCGGMYLGRLSLGLNTLAASGLVVLLLNPADLFRVGPQLSFLAVGCLVWLGTTTGNTQAVDPLDRLISKTRPWPQRLLKHQWRLVRELTWASLLIWAVSLPLVMYHFHIVSLVALLLNTVLALPVLVAMVSGFGAIVLGMILPTGAALLGAICNASFAVIDLLIHAGNKLPGSYFWTPGPAWWWLLGFYGVLITLHLLSRYAPQVRWRWAMLLAWITLGFGVAIGSKISSYQNLTVTYASVGHGCGVIVELPEGQTLLYDAGQLGSPYLGMQAISQSLWSRGITHLDAVVLSHADVDHYNALPGLLDRFTVGRVYVSPQMFDQESAALTALASALQRHEIPMLELWAGDRLQTSDAVRVEVLHPPRTGVLGGDNANSMVLTIEFAGRRFLLPGDLESVGLRDLLAEMPRKCDFLLSPHHGSVRSNPIELAEWAEPDWVIVSGSYSDAVSQVAQTYQQVGAELFHTADSGAVSVKVTPDGQYRLGTVLQNRVKQD